MKSISDLFNLVKTFDKDFKPNPSSVVVNADGTPKVVYHGTSKENGEFYIFDYNKAKKKLGLGFKAYGKQKQVTALKLTQQPVLIT